MIELKKNIPLIGKVNLKDPDIIAFIKAEHGDYFFIPCKDREQMKLEQSKYCCKFSRVKNRIGKSDFKLTSRTVDGGVGFWFVDLTVTEDNLNIKKS